MKTFVKNIFFVLLFASLFIGNKSKAQEKKEYLFNGRESHADFLIITGSNTEIKSNKENGGAVNRDTGSVKINKSKSTRYRRASLYTLVTNNPSKAYNIPMINSFGNASNVVPEKFNDHNIGPYQVPIEKSIDIPGQIENYLNKSKVANQLVAKWFRRTKDGTFDMKLVAERGEYDASFMEQSIAMKTVRGSSMLQDAGEDLLSNTFIIVYDYNFADKNKSFKIDLDVYVYRLIWDEATANNFYSNYWIERNTVNTSRKEAFENSSDFKVMYVSKYPNITSVVMRYPDNFDYTVDKSYARVKSNIEYNFELKDLFKNSLFKLEEAMEDLRTKFQLYSVDPIAAKIGTKEDVKAGDKFEVLEKTWNANGKVKYKRLGVIRVVNSNKIWDNNTSGSWIQSESSKLEYTEFEGEKNKYTPGMLFRKIYQ
jgi:hypothetical protein